MKILTTLFLLVAVVSTVAAAPDASRVVVRGRTDLTELLKAATKSAWREGAPPKGVAIVIDVTPFTQLAGPRIRAALESMGEEILNLGGQWSIGALGRPLMKAVRHPAALVPLVSRVTAAETKEKSTVRALRRSLANFRDAGVVVYLADWRLEEDQGLEGFIKELKRRGQVLNVIGTEGCFNRGWSDAFFPRYRVDARQKYEPGIGRHPFGPAKKDAPWHSGDTAYPHVPWHFGVPAFRTSFAQGMQRLRDDESSRLDADEFTKPEILEARLREVTEEIAGLAFPLSSSFGPWPLMRACAETGGHYYLFSFNPFGRTDLEYDYARCNQFAPDLRSRRDILADAQRRPLARALMKAWRALGSRKAGLVSITAPFSPGGAPAEMKEVEANDTLAWAWCRKELHAYFLRVTREHLDALDEAARTLDQVLAVPKARDGVDRRYRADAEMLRHIVAIYRFEIRESIAAAQAVKPDAWEDKKTCPGIAPEVWIARGGDPEGVHTADHLGAWQPEAGKKIAEARRVYLRKYRGTPFGETVARNAVHTFRLKRYVRVEDDGDGPPAASTPSESGARKAPTARAGPGSSSGGGASSGK